MAITNTAKAWYHWLDKTNKQDLYHDKSSNSRGEGFFMESRRVNIENLMIQEILIPFVSIGLAELGDKTQLAVLCLASKTEKYLQLLSGVILAFAITDGLAILLGNFITAHIPIVYIKIVSGAIFIIFGLITLRTPRPKPPVVI